MNTGESPNVEWLCQQAVDSGEWDVVLQLIERGVSAALRTSLLQCALGHQHVQCTARLLDLGVSKHCREEGLRKQIATGHGDFVLEVVRKVRDPDLTDFVLRESMKQSQWPLVSGLLKEGLSVAQMESVCDQAVADQQWTVAFQLLGDGVSPSERMVSELFQNNKAQDLLDLFPVGSVPEGLKGLLLMASVRCQLGDLTQHVLQRESVSDSQLMEAIKLSVHLKDKTTFLLLIRDCPKGRRVFKQKFVHQQWKESLQPLEGDVGEVRWMFGTLFDCGDGDGDGDLALFVATSAKTACPCISDFCQHVSLELLGPSAKSLRYFLTKLHEFDHKKYIVFVHKLYPLYSKSIHLILLHHILQVEEWGLILDLCDFDLSRKELKFVCEWLVRGMENVDPFSRLCQEIPWKEDWLRQHALKCSMKAYFERRSDINLKIFILHFRSITVSTDNGNKFVSRMFRKAVTKCVELDLAECFAMLCKKYKKNSRYYFSKSTVRRDIDFAYASAVDGNHPHFISKLFEKLPKYMFQGPHETVSLVSTILKRKAWSMLSLVPAAGLKHLLTSDMGVPELERCVLNMRYQNAWPHIAPFVDQWIRHCEVDGNTLKTMMTSVKAKIAAGWRPLRVSRVTKWCVDHGHFNLAFFLALVTEDDEMLTTVVTAPPSLDLHHNWLWTAVDLAGERRKFSTCAAVLNLLPLKDSIEDHWKRIRHMRDQNDLASACEEKGLVDWALVLMADSSTYIVEKCQLCQNPHVLDFLLTKALGSRAWDVVRALVFGANHSVVRYVLKRAIIDGQKSLAEELFHRVDPTIRYSVDNNLFSAAALSSDMVRGDMTRLCISAGLASFQRKLQRNPQDLHILGAKEWKTIKQLLASGAFSNKRLHWVWKYIENRMKEKQKNGDSISHQSKVLSRWIREAASTPCRLEHLARLAVSHSIGCQPGRSQRIHSLPVPEPVKYLLRFKDVVSLDLGEDDLL